MAQDLNTFYTTATQRGFSRDYQARVSSLCINGQSLTEQDLVYIKNVSIPNKKAAITTVRYFGADFHSTGTRDFGDSKNWTLTFYTDQVMYLKRWFEERLNEIASNVSIGNTTGDRLNVNPVPGTDSYAVLDIVDDNLSTVIYYKLNGLFVVDVPGVSYDMAGAGKAQEFKVTLGYQYWDVTDNASGIIPYQQNGGGGLLGTLNAITGTINAVGNLAKSTRSAIKSIRGK